jgi:hypothetical protein
VEELILVNIIMSRKITLSAFLLLNALFSFADQVTPEQAKSTAMQFLASRSAASVKGVQRVGRALEVCQVYPSTAAVKGRDGVVTTSDPGYYIFNATNDNSFVVVSGESTMRPVLAYSLEGQFDVNNIPDGLQYWLNIYADQAKLVKEGKATAVKYSPKVEAAATQKVLSTALWSQESPYNNQCPRMSWYKTSDSISYRSSTARCVTGCVATAMAIVMKYHKWPDRGVGSNTYTTKHPVSSNTWYNSTTTNYYITQSLDFTNKGYYDWDNMLDSYSSYSSVQGSAVAELMHCCGVAINMDYWDSSNAESIDQVKAMRNNFRYSRYAHEIDRTTFKSWNTNGTYTSDLIYPDAEWKKALAAEIDAGRPMLYTGLSSNSSIEEGHSFVCDGYDSDGLFHFNFGWGSSSYNCFCDIDNIQPNNSSYQFNYLQCAIVGLEPDKTSDYLTYDDPLHFRTDKTKTSCLTLSSGSILQGTNFTVNASFVGNGQVNRLFNGTIKCGLYSADGKLKAIISDAYDYKQGYISRDGVTHTDYTGNLDTYAYFKPFDLKCQIPSTTAYSATDRVWLISSIDDGKTWNRVYGADEASSSLPMSEGMAVSDVSATDGTQTVSVYGDLTTTDLTTIKGNESLTTVDLSNATNLGETVDVTGTNPNAFVKLPTGSTATVTGALVYGANGDITLTDANPIAADGIPTATSVSYTRSFNTATNFTESTFSQPRWQTICLPFNVTRVSAKTTSDVSRIFNPDDYWLYKIDNGTYTRVTSASEGIQIEANKPYLIGFINMTGYKDYNVSGPVTFKGETLNNTLQTLKTEEQTLTYSNKYTLQGYYGAVLKTTNFILDDEGKLFVTSSDAKVAPFHPFAITSNNVKGNTLDVFGNSTTGIGTIGSDTAPDALVKPVSGGLDIKSRKAGTVTVTTVGGMVLGVYSVGPTTRHIALPIGLCIVNGKKYLVKE